MVLRRKYFKEGKKKNIEKESERLNVYTRQWIAIDENSFFFNFFFCFFAETNVCNRFTAIKHFLKKDDVFWSFVNEWFSVKIDVFLSNTPLVYQKINYRTLYNPITKQFLSHAHSARVHPSVNYHHILKLNFEHFQ